MTTSRITGLLTAPLAIALALALGPALAAHALSSTTKKDPRDDVFLASVGGGIDVAGVNFRTLDRKRRIQVTFTLHSRVPEGSLEGPGGLTAQFIKDRRTSQLVKIFMREGDLRGKVCTETKGDLTRLHDCHTLPVTQVDAKTYRTVVKRDRIKKDASVLHWIAWSLDLSSGDPVSDVLTAMDGKPFRWQL
jgi:hypothetical protein